MFQVFIRLKQFLLSDLWWWAVAWLLSCDCCVVADFMTGLGFLTYYFQWGFRGIFAAAEAVLDWIDAPPPWPDEVLCHKYPRHHRKFGVYYRVRMAGCLLTLLLMELFPSMISNLGHISINFNSLEVEPFCLTTNGLFGMVIIDTGASVCISPNKSDFITYSKSDMKIKDLTTINRVAGEGLIRWSFENELGEITHVDVPGYHMKSATVRLLSPQVIFHHLGGSGLQDKDAYRLSIRGDTFTAPYCPRSRLPILSLSNSSESSHSFWASAFHFTSTDVDAYPVVLDKQNVNLSAAQKEVLLWHQRLCHASIRWIQLLMRDRKWLKSRTSDDALHSGPFLPCLNRRGPTCDILPLKCASCLLGKAHRRTPESHKQQVTDPDATNDFRKRVDGTLPKILKRGHLHPGDCVSADHYVSSVQGRLYDSFGREKHGYSCGTLFVDHASGHVFNYCQLSTSANATIASKHQFESIARQAGHRIKSYHSDNGTFASTAFKDDCHMSQQTITFSGVGAHHQNGVAERNIKTISQWARASMLHAASHWPAQANLKLWPQAIDYAIWVFNRLPSMSTGLSPQECWFQVRMSGDELRRAHVFGCPVYVLDPVLQDGHKIPKWEPRARLGLFVGFSKEHSSLVPLVLNVTTGKISPQFHVIFDDKFETVHSPAGVDASASEQWDHLLSFKLERDCYLDGDFASDGTPLRDPSATFDWNQLPSRDFYPPTQPPPGGEPSFDRDLPPLTPSSPLIGEAPTAPPLQQIPDHHEPSFENIVDDYPSSPNSPTHSSNDFPTLSERAISPTPSPSVPMPSPPAQVPEGAVRPKRNVGTYKDGPAVARRLPIDGEEYELAYLLDNECDALPAFVSNRGHSTIQPTPHKISKAYLIECNLLSDNWCDADPSVYLAEYLHFAYDHEAFHIADVIDPRLLQAKANHPVSKYSADNPSFEQAMRGPFQSEFTKAMLEELHTLVHEFKCWTLVKQLPSMKVLPSVWAFKIKRFPDGLLKKFKARFCARGDRQVEGVDYFDTWAPVVMWSTIRTVMVLSLVMGWVSAQCDITAAFIHAFIPTNETIYVHQPRGFRVKPGYVLKLNRTLYGLRQSPRLFYLHLTERLLRQGLTASKLDPCLFYSSNLMVIIYVDDLLIYAPDDAAIDDFILRMQSEDITLRREGTAEGYLGVNITKNGDSVILTQPGLTARIISALGLDNKYSVGSATPAECAPLPKDSDGDPASGTINYASIIGMLLYLCGHSRPDISFAVHQCARYTFAPTRRHEKALIRIGRYLKSTADKGLILTPSSSLHLDCYPDADFAGLWNHEESADPHCVRSRTGYTITLSNCPVLWVSKLQTEIALSTMEAEYIAMSQACKDLFPIMDLVSELSTGFGLPFAHGSQFHVKIHEDNVGALTLGKLEPRRMTLRSKHYALKYHWFREHILPRNIILVKIDSKHQLGDLFTKGLGRVAFSNLRKKLMGW